MVGVLNALSLARALRSLLCSRELAPLLSQSVVRITQVLQAT